ncbi:MAG: hypothetical protein MI919_29105, partial [Holophagales bacterium]|nr:hypothetical protein [Holophagales bacterium]
RIEVRVRRTGLRVRHRRTFRPTTPGEQMLSRVLSAMHLGESANPLGIRLGSGALRPVDGGEAGRGYVLPLHVQAPADRLTYLPTGAGESASLELLISTRGAGHPSPPATLRRFTVPRPGDPAAWIDLPVELELGLGIHVLGVGLQDAASAESSYVSTTVAIGPVNPE